MVRTPGKCIYYVHGRRMLFDRGTTIPLSNSGFHPTTRGFDWTVVSTRGFWTSQDLKSSNWHVGIWMWWSKSALDTTLTIHKSTICSRPPQPRQATAFAAHIWAIILFIYLLRKSSCCHTLQVPSFTHHTLLCFVQTANFDLHHGRFHWFTSLFATTWDGTALHTP